MNWALITTVVLTLSSSYPTDFTGFTRNGSVTVPLEQVVYAQADKDEVSVTRVLGSDGGTISVDFGDALRQVVIPAGALLTTVPVTVTVNATPDTDYPDNAELRRTYPPELLKYISPKLTVELPLEALDWQNSEDLTELLYLSPGFNKGTYQEGVPIRAEIRTKLADGTNTLSFDPYSPDAFVTVFATDLRVSFYDEASDTLEISVQIVDETATSAVNSPSESKSKLTKLPDAPDSLAAFTELPYTSYDPFADKNVSKKVMVYNMWPSLNNVILIAFELAATVGKVNAVLEELDAEIVGVLPGISRDLGLVLTIKILPRTAEELERLFRELDAKPSVDTTMPYLMAYDLLLDF